MTAQATIPTLAIALDSYLDGGKRVKDAVAHIIKVAAEGRKGAAIFAARRELIAGEMDRARQRAKARCRLEKGEWGNKDCPTYDTIRNALDYLRRCVQDATGLSIVTPRGADNYTATIPAAKAPKVKSKAPASPAQKAPLQGDANGTDGEDSAPSFNDEPEQFADTVPEIVAGNRAAYLLAMAGAYGSKAELLAAIKELPDDVFGTTAEIVAEKAAAKVAAKKEKQAARVAKVAAKKAPLVPFNAATRQAPADSATPASVTPASLAAEIAALESHLKTGAAH